MAPSSIDVVKSTVAPQVPHPVVISKSDQPEAPPVEDSPAPVVQPQSSVTNEDLEKIAKDIEQAFGSTRVTFEGGSPGAPQKIKFSVVDEKTGEVVLRFPLEAGQSAQQHLAAKDSKGILLTRKA